MTQILKKIVNQTLIPIKPKYGQNVLIKTTLQKKPKNLAKA